MGIDDALARANEQEARELADQRESQALYLKQKEVAAALLKDFVDRVKRAGVQPMTLKVLRRETTFFKKTRFVDVPIGRAWIVEKYTRDDYQSYMSCFAVTEDGAGVSASIIYDAVPVFLRTDEPSNEVHYHQPRPSWIDRETYEREELKNTADRLSEMLAKALRDFGAV